MKVRICNVKNKTNQRLPGACNRSPGSKLLSITTKLKEPEFDIGRNTLDLIYSQALCW
jgi:hypothetical protein